ncbi:MAG: DNA repair ATPase, partial [Oleiphilaceae bacterium]|nr:DNA repair ATPase [Oleiphilaceae bacterium]
MGQHDDTASQEQGLVDQAVAEGGAYEIIRKRLVEQGKTLAEHTQTLNSGRLEEFGSSDMEVVGRVRVRTENNCIARDIVQVGTTLLFGYNVFIGLKKETAINDVFALFEVKENGQGFELDEVPLEGSFLADAGFAKDFDELYRYYKDTRLIQLRVKDGKLLAGFQIGERLSDVRVFRWAMAPDGSVTYIDNRGERDLELPSPYDFEWVYTTRDDTVQGRHPHVNVLDTVFVETTGGDLTIKVENNTETGLGVFSEPVEDATQSLDDAQIAYAQVGKLILLKVRPYREEQWRYLIFNTLTEEVLRVDAIGESCVQLPEDHGVIFPGGYYLESGEFKSFDDGVTGLKFKRVIRSPNGEDVLYVFYQPEQGMVALFAYNMIKKQLQNPVYGHGYALAENGRLVIFQAEDEPTRVHPMQIWK